MSLTTKVVQRATDPVFYRKRIRDHFGRFKKFKDSPAPLDIRKSPWKKAVCAVAHPDDETFCSGLICELIECDIEVTVLCVTKGEGGPTGGLERSKLGEARAAEMQDACNKLGVSELHFMNHIDPVAAQFRVYAPDVSASALASQIRTMTGDADLIISHGSCGEYWHPAHLLVFDAVKILKKSLKGRLDWLTFLARQPGHPMPRLVNWDDEADLQLNASHHSTVREQALACHKSQLGLFGRFAGGDYKDFIDKTSIESFRKY